MSEFKSVVDAIDAGNKALEEHRKLAEQIIEKQNKGEAGLSDIISKQHGFFDEMTKNFRAVEDAVAKANKPNLANVEAQETEAAVKQYGVDFKSWMRGNINDQEMTQIVTKARQTKALAESTNSGADGGYALPKVIDTMIDGYLVNISAMRQLATVVQIGTPDYHRLFNIKGTASGWVAETAARSATNTPQLADVKITPFELYANPQATQVMMDDVFFDAESWLAGEVAQEFARAEGAAFLVGNGTTQPLGLLAGTAPTNVVDNSTRPLGTLQYVPTGVAADWATTSSTVSKSDVIFTLVGSLKAGYRDNASFLLNKATLFEVSAFKDSTGRYIYNPIAAPGVLPNLLGYPVMEAEDMPAKAANAFPLAFGDFSKAYVIVDRKGITTLRDPYTNKPYVGFYTVKRVGGGLMNTEAVKLVKFAVS